MANVTEKVIHFTFGPKWDIKNRNNLMGGLQQCPEPLMHTQQNRSSSSKFILMMLPIEAIEGIMRMYSLEYSVSKLSHTMMEIQVRTFLI